MADTTQFTTYAAQVNPPAGIQQINTKPGAWVAVLVGPIVGTSKVEVTSDGTEKKNPTAFEWIERASGAAPDPSLKGHVLFAGESEIIGDLGAGQSIWARCKDTEGGVLVATPGS